MRIPVAGIPRFPGAGSSARGQSAPKARPKGVADGQQADIPVLPILVMREAGTQEDSRSALQEMRVQAMRIFE